MMLVGKPHLGELHLEKFRCAINLYWFQVTLGKQSLGKKVVCIFSNISIIFIYVILSSIMYCLLLRHKGVLGVSSVGPVGPEESREPGNSLSSERSGAQGKFIPLTHA